MIVSSAARSASGYVGLLRFGWIFGLDVLVACACLFWCLEEILNLSGRFWLDSRIPYLSFDEFPSWMSGGGL